VDYVLGRPSRDAAVAIEASLDDGVAALVDIIPGQFSKAMNRLHASR
jgi:peptidyl-tRNA hydrolase